MTMDNDMRVQLEELTQLDSEYLRVVFSTEQERNDCLTQLSQVEPQPYQSPKRESLGQAGCIVKNWQFVNIIRADEPMLLLYGTVVDDRYGRFQPGDYVFSSLISRIDNDKGLVYTRNSVYGLVGNGERVHATIAEAYRMKTMGRSIQMIRNLHHIAAKIGGSVKIDPT